MFFEVKNLCYSYIKSPLCLKDINFSFAKNDTVMLIASKEQGKTTFLKVVSTFDNNYFGWIRLDGKDLKKVSDDEKRFSLLLDRPVFFENKSIKQNMEYFCEVSKLEKLSDEKLKNLLNEFLIDETIEQKVKKLSLASKHKLQMLRAFLKQSQIVFVDDLFENIEGDELFEVFEVFESKILKLESAKVFAIGDNSFKKIKNKLQNLKLNKVIYLNLAEIVEFESINKFESSFAKLDVFNFFDTYNFFDATLFFDKDFYYVELDDEKIFRIDKKFNNKLKILKLENFDSEPCKLVVENDVNLEKLSENDINGMIEKHELFLFSALDGSRLI